MNGYVIPKDLEATLRGHRRTIHRFAEVGFNTENTLSYIERYLKRLGLAPRRCGRSGLVADIGEGDDVTLLRADVDALRMSEKSGEEFAATNGNMHACGHDLNTAMLLGAAEILSVNKERLKGRVRLMFQSAEETLEGCLDMISAADILSGVGRAFMIHTTVSTEFETGTVILPPKGVATPAADFFTFVIKGKSGHSADPDSSSDAISLAIRLYGELSGLTGSPRFSNEKIVFSVGMLQGGTAPNVICDLVTMKGTLRTYKREARAAILSEFSKICKRLSNGAASVTFSVDSGCPSFLCDGYLCDRVHSLLTKSYDKPIIKTPEGTAGGGSEDIAYISERIPSVMIILSAGSRSEGYLTPLHHPECRFSEDALIRGAKMYALCALKC